MDDLDRFLSAQAEIWPRALTELTAGAKRSHWMWFVFPQIAGLGHSEMARRYALQSVADARAYLAQPVLGARLVQGTRALLGHAGDRSAETILGGIDAVKFRSSMTLFEAAAAEGSAEREVFAAALDAFYGGARDPATLARLGA